MQAGSYSWRGGEGSQTDLNGDDRKPPERVHDPRYPENPNAFCCDESEETAAVARSQPATGFVYMVNRFYEPETGRFTQADKLPFDPTQLTNAQNNRWTYCGSDPVNLTDPTGSYVPFIALLILAALIVLIIAALLSFIVQFAARWCFGFAIRKATGLGPLGWLGVFLFAVGMLITVFSFGALGIIGGLLVLLGFIFLRIDIAISQLVDRVFDWIVSTDSGPIVTAIKGKPEKLRSKLLDRFFDYAYV